jgi:hypothetical protein
MNITITIALCLAVSSCASNVRGPESVEHVPLEENVSRSN